MSNFMSTPGSGWAKSVFQVGRGRTLTIPLEIHQAARKKLVELFRKKESEWSNPFTRRRRTMPI